MAKTRRVISIAIEGEDDSDLDFAFSEVSSKINDGFKLGVDNNDTGSYSFTVTDREIT